MRSWMCSSCSQGFSRKGDLKRHLRLHTGIKPHVCEVCRKAFAQYSGLKTHHNTHTKAKPYACGIGTCKKAFGDPSSCTRHRKETHSREGAYKCIVPECGVKIKRRSAFVAHMKKKHGIDIRALDLDVISSSANNRNSQESNFHFLPPYVPDTPYCPPSKTDIEPAIAHCTAAAPMPMSNYQMHVPQYGGNSGVADSTYDYRWPSILGTERSISSLIPMHSMSTFPLSHIDDYPGNVFDDGYNGYLQSDDMFSRLPSPYPSVSPPLPPLLDGFIDSLGSRMRSLSSSPAASSSSALDDPLDFAFLEHNVPHQYLLFSTN